MVLSSCSGLSTPLTLATFSPLSSSFLFFLPAVTESSSPLSSWPFGSSLCHSGIQTAITTIIPSDCFLHLEAVWIPTSFSHIFIPQECGQQDLFNPSAPFVMCLLPGLRVSWFSSLRPRGPSAAGIGTFVPPLTAIPSPQTPRGSQQTAVGWSAPSVLPLGSRIA